MKFLPYGCQDINESDIDSVVKVLKSDFLTQGPAIGRFESIMCEKTGARFATACSNGTAALHLAMLAAGITHGDRVLVSPVTFVASANCARYCGASVEFADIDSDSCNISPAECRLILAKAREEGRPFRAIVTVDLAGKPCDMEAFAEIKKEFNLVWIQDACHSIGATWRDRSGKSWKTGEWNVPDMTVYSFHPVKHITTGEGGMITTHSEKLSRDLKLFRTHGITKENDKFIFPEEAFSDGSEPNPWYYEMQVLGYNYRLSDFQAALGTSQLERLDSYVKRRQEIARLYDAGFKGERLIKTPFISSEFLSSYHLYVLRIDFAGAGKNRAKVMRELREKGIGTQVHYIPVPMMPYYAGTSSMRELPNSLAYYREALSIPCYPRLNDEDIERVVCSVKDVVNG